MKIKQKVVTFIAAGIAVMGLTATYAPHAMAAECAGVKTSIIGGDICGDAKTEGEAQDSAIWAILLLVLNILTAGVGIAAVGGIVYGSIMYSSAGDSQDQTRKAMDIIKNTVIGLIAYGLMYLVLNFLIPGGIFK
ncbi:hypothetical protein PV379_03385 [Streptomyces caniscabiei]|uniref:hypothetical protein n=1 Tax=Streptomyces caniscabiei TaxID=2746961 RepID=UPI0029B196CE|nr:hypothetical protein [Streptomyces caniscabiei]MDX2776382.1 hypothetical protein [Streptomyces caniscabiei]